MKQLCWIWQKLSINFWDYSWSPKWSFSWMWSEQTLRVHIFELWKNREIIIRWRHVCQTSDMSCHQLEKNLGLSLWYIASHQSNRYQRKEPFHLAWAKFSVITMILRLTEELISSAVKSVRIPLKQLAPKHRGHTVGEFWVVGFFWTTAKKKQHHLLLPSGQKSRILSFKKWQEKIIITLT